MEYRRLIYSQMKKIFLTAVIVFFSITFSFAQNITKIKMDDVLKMIDSSKTPLIINFWATWCRPCIEEIPRLESNVDSFKTLGAKLILISVDFAKDFDSRLVPFVKQHGYSADVYWLDENDPAEFCPRIDKHWAGKIPAILMVNNAKHYREFYNYSLVEYQLEAYLKDLIIR
jgi:thiol-disulfide isomerase/thioredoxin